MEISLNKTHSLKNPFFFFVFFEVGKFLANPLPTPGRFLKELLLVVPLRLRLLVRPHEHRPGHRYEAQLTLEDDITHTNWGKKLLLAMKRKTRPAIP